MESYKFCNNCKLSLPLKSMTVEDNFNIIIIGNTEGFVGYESDIENPFSDKTCFMRWAWFSNMVCNSTVNITVIGPSNVDKYWKKIIAYILRDCKSKNRYNIKRRYENHIIKSNDEYFDMLENFADKNMIFDVCLMNPPYGTKGDTIANKMFNKVNDICNNVVSIQPSAFITKDKSTRTVYEEKRSLDIFDKFGAYIEIVNEKIFDADLQQELAIIHIIKGGTNDIVVKNKFGTSVYDSANKINKYNNDNTINQFYSVVKLLSDNDSVHKHIIVTDPRDDKSMQLKTQDEGQKYYVKISYLRGNIGTDDMETFIPRDTVPKKEGRGRCYINFSNKNVARNFINYLKSDFARMSLWFIKNDTALAYNTKLVPWFDFSDTHFSKTPKEIDDYLFSKFEISKDARKKIEEILPDYYEIRN